MDDEEDDPADEVEGGAEEAVEGLEEAPQENNDPKPAIQEDAPSGSEAYVDV